MAALLLPALSSGCGVDPFPGPDPAWLELELGDPVPGLSEEEVASFERGRALFTRVFRSEDGLGPIFAASACDACHTDPVAGGVATDESMYVLRTSRWSEEEGCDLLLDHGGDFVRERSTPELQAAGIHGDRFPEEAIHVTRYSMRPLYGLGLVEAIPDRTILALADPEDLLRNGITGRAPLDADGRVTPFVRFLAPPAPRVPTDPGQRRVVEEGRNHFLSVGCGMCHVPSLVTGPSEIPALAHQAVYLYSDLLLHDMGDDLAGTCGPTAGPTEIRTEMLWGLQYRDRFMHDGRALTLREAIELHGGTAAGSRELFWKLSPMEQQALLRFLDTL